MIGHGALQPWGIPMGSAWDTYICLSQIRSSIHVHACMCLDTHIDIYIFTYIYIYI